MPPVFLSLKRGKVTFFLEMDSAIRVRSIVENISKSLERPVDEVALMYNGHRLGEGKTLEECGLKHEKPNIVEPLLLYFVFKNTDTDEWEEPNQTPPSVPPALDESLAPKEES
jgi:hypothetical protein